MLINVLIRHCLSPILPIGVGTSGVPVSSFVSLVSNHHDHLIDGSCCVTNLKPTQEHIDRPSKQTVHSSLNLVYILQLHQDFSFILTGSDNVDKET